MTIHASSTGAFEGIPDSGLLLPPTATPLTGDIHTRTSELFAPVGAASSVGFWQASIGRSHWNFEDYSEAILVLAGRVVVTEDGGEPVALGPGDVAVFPLGWTGEWHVTEELRKFYVVFP